MILVIGASGMVGKAVVHALAKGGHKVRALVHRADQKLELEALGACDTGCGDILDSEFVKSQVLGVDRIYHICPAVNPYEVEIGLNVLNAAEDCGVSHFVYQSVLHSDFVDMPHHQKKMIVEGYVKRSRIPFTIAKPAVFMQNISNLWPRIVKDGVFDQRFYSGNETRMNMLDLNDFSECVVKILTSDDHFYASYELCGSENLSLQDVLDSMKSILGIDVVAKSTSATEWAAMMRIRKFGDYQIETLLTMFDHYNRDGFLGNSNVASCLLGRRLRTLSDFFSELAQSVSFLG